MDVILHIGAHRTASSSFQSYLRGSGADLRAMGLGFWGPLRTRKGLFHGILPAEANPKKAKAFMRAQGRIALHLERVRQSGCTQLIVSDENMLGMMRANFAQEKLYPAAGERVALYCGGFQGAVKAIYLSIRCPSTYWPSALSYCIPRGVLVPRSDRIAALCTQKRSWRDVITDVAAAAPTVPVFVSTFEEFSGRPHRILSYLTGAKMPAPPTAIWRNQRPRTQELLGLALGAREKTRLQSQIHDGSWEPFSQAQRLRLQETYADDLFWLRSGADGLAHLLEIPKPEKTVYTAQTATGSKGQTHDTRQRLARPG